MSDQLSERLAGLSPQAQRAWLTQLLHRRQHAPTRAPLSFAQERLWILHQLDPNSAAYHIPLALRLTGTLDLSALRHSLNAVVQRHAVLRTTFVLEAGQALQVIAPHLTLEAPVVEVDARSLAEREAQLQQALQEEARQPFDLSRGPLLRARVWRLGPAEHVLLVTLHHSVADAWSVAIFSRELAALYQAALARQPAALLDLPLQYADYAAWQREWLRGELLESQLVYWQQQLTGAPELLTWPADHPRPAVQTQRGATQFFTLSPEVTAGLTAFSRHEGVTLFMTLLAAFNVLLHRYTGQTDIVVGTPVANRNRRELEELIGFFVNTLALRTRLGGGDTVRELVRRVREGVLAATAHQDVPFERVVEHLQPVRQLDRSPVFQVLLGLQNVPGAVLELPGVQVEALAVETGAAAFDLTLLLEERAGGLRGVVEYSTDLFEATTIARLVEHFQVVLEGMVADPEQRLAQLPLLTEAERQQVLVEWNDTAVDYPHDGCIHRLFEAQVERTPDAVAVVYEDQSLTYGELNGRANRLAHYLRRLGIGPERLVGMCFDRSVEMIVSVLGALKAGGAYLPLDPSYPIERLAFMLEDSQAPVLLTQSHWLAARSAPLGVSEIVCLDTDWSVIAQESDQNPDSVTTAADLAYVIYTSGSTGRPKGVMIPHRSVLNLFTGLNRTIYANHPQRPMRISLNAPLPFDASVQQWVMLLKGHTLYIVPQAARQDGNALVSYIRRNQLDVLDCVPSQLKLLLAAGLLDGTGWAPSIVLPGGEALDEATWQTLTRAAGTDFYNMYGPTECTVDSTVCRMKTAASQPTIGRPIANARCYILDAQLQPVPIGVSGELHMGGLGLARGYLNRPDLTAERFIPNPFLKDDYSPRSEAEWEGGGRRDEENFSDSSLILHHLPPKRSGGGSSLLYKTGDLARYLSDGNLEFLGRIDQQVKVRGFRIELGEIEAALSQHPAVRECVVAAQAWGATDDKRLVAYLTPKADASSSFIPPPSSFVSELRAFLRVKLPEYMLPSAFVVLEAFPLTPNGKVDRKALPALDGAQVAASEHYVAPRTPAEELAAGIWAEVLGIKTVGVNDNFFELGGHSLLATQVVSRIQEVFQVQLPLRALFESPTLEDLARAIEQLQQGDAPRPFRAIQPVSRAGELPLSFAQERLWFIDQLVPGSSAYNIPTALRIKGDLDVAALESSLNEVIRRHESLRTTFAAHDGQSMQVIAPNVILKLPSVDLRAWPEADRESEARRRAEAEARRPFDLAHGPLLRAELFCLDQAAHVLVLNLHHIIADGWSSAVLVREVTELYAAFAQEQSPALGAERRGLPLPELPIQYADFAVWQRQWLQGEVLDAQLAYWRRQLAGLPILELPTDRPRPPAQTFRGGTQAFRLSPALTQALASLSQREGATLFMTLLAAFQTLLARYTGQTDIAVGTGIANRRRAEIEGLIGFFVNTLVLRTDLAGNPTFREVLARVREVALEAYAHQDAPFELVVDAVGPQRDLSHSPLFQVFFVLQNMPQQALKLAGFEIELLPVDNGTAKFDLGFQLYEVDDGLYGLVEYSVDLFEADTIQRLVGHYAMLLESVVAHPDQPIALLPLLPEAERRQLLEVWNDTAAALPADACAQQLFEAQVARTPAAIAVRFAGESLTYAELNRRANQLAHHLRRYGVGPEVRVGILIERSIEMVVGVLGVLKAGAAYVPLDPEYPASRLAFMLQDAGVNVLLAHAPLLSKLPEHNARVICLDTDWSAIAQSPSSNLCVSVAPENLAYVIYTSGSTGLPKGTLLHHRGLCNLAQTLRDKFELGSESRLLQFAAFSFDASVSEMFAALTTGARLVLAPREQLLSPLDLIELLQTEGITCVTLPPSLLAVLSTAELPALRTLISAGEACPWEVAERWAEGRRFLNGYGPTETTVAASYYEVNERVAGAQLVPIGKPNPNTTIYLLDSNGQPAPIGVPGEICIGGVGVGRGYLNRPDLTAEKFIPNPFFDEGRRTTDEGRNAGSAPLSSFVHRHSSSRLYRTGDLARWRPDG
ncbi:MAG TPA: amino acid adenylation domain-containing protein, partial [Anaerolineae bacterium]|nr:amino acid adenylation domain-containing protein [Anaerolineae bacterium]